MVTNTLEASVSPGYDSNRFPAFGVTVDVVRGSSKRDAARADGR